MVRPHLGMPHAHDVYITASAHPSQCFHGARVATSQQTHGMESMNSPHSEKKQLNPSYEISANAAQEDAVTKADTCSA